MKLHAFSQLFACVVSMCVKLPLSFTIVTYIDTHKYIVMHAYIQHTHAHTHAHAHTNTYIHTYTHIYIHIDAFVYVVIVCIVSSVLYVCCIREWGCTLDIYCNT